MPMKNPPHPGDLIKSEIFEALGLSISKAAGILGVRRATLSDLVNCKSSLTPRNGFAHRKSFRSRYGSSAANAAGL